MAFFFGCATVPTETDLKGSLRTNAERYWNLRLNEKFEDTYEMENDQGLPPYEKYRALAGAMKKISIVSISVKEVNIDGVKGEVDMNWRYMLPAASKPFHETIKDYWTFVDGKWRHLSYPGAAK